MKKILLSFAAFSALIFSCKEKTTAQIETQNETEAAAETVFIEEEKEPQRVPSRIIYSGWDLYEEKNDGKMYAIKEAECGDEAEIYLKDDNSIEQKNAIRHLQNGKEEKLNFVRVRYDGEDYWTRDIFLSGANVSLQFVILKDSFAYSAPNGSSITDKVLEEGTFVAVESGENSEFLKAVIYNSNPFGKEIYLKRDFATDDETMKEIVRAFSRISEETRNSVRNEITEKTLAEQFGRIDSAGKDFVAAKIAKFREKNIISEKNFRAFKEMYGGSVALGD